MLARQRVNDNHRKNDALLVLFLIQLETSFRNTNEHTLHR